MTKAPASKDLIVLTADKNCQFALRGVLSRSQALGIRKPETDFYVHPEKDPGVVRHAHEFLRAFIRSYAHALIVVDLEGSGRESDRREDLEAKIERALDETGWENRASAIVVDPELDVWVWSDSPHVATELGWANRRPKLRDWLEQQGLLTANVPKPARPKEALEAALRQVRKPRSSAIYQALAERVSLSRCTDPAFLKLKTVLGLWFQES
jgi:hypothetical protein